ncbi:unnamed protein product, partial [Acidithrix sp. C25]
VTNRIASQQIQRIVIVKDDRAVRDSIATVLRLKEYVIEPCKDGEDALLAIENEPPDAIILDIMMPKLDGLSATREIRRRGYKTPS